MLFLKKSNDFEKLGLMNIKEFIETLRKLPGMKENLPGIPKT